MAVSLFGASQGGQLAATIAARYPDRVGTLVLYGTCACGADLAPPDVRESVVALVRAHWGLGLKVLTGAFVTDPTAGEQAALTQFQRASASATVAARLLEVYYGWRRRSASSASPRVRGPLTSRELEVADLVAEGLTNYSIAMRLSVAPRTAEAHVENIRRKLQVHSRAQIAAWVTEHRLRSAGPR